MKCDTLEKQCSRRIAWQPMTFAINRDTVHLLCKHFTNYDALDSAHGVAVVEVQLKG